MIQSLHCLIGTSLNPYLNLATEEYLLDTVKPGQLILYSVSYTHLTLPTN